jgi:hypothetical protein
VARPSAAHRADGNGAIQSLRIRKGIGKVSGDSTTDIREWRDNKERYR